MDEQKQMILQILEAIDYEEKEVVAEELNRMIFEEVIYQLMHTLEGAKREKIAKQWQANEKNPAALLSILHHNFTQEQINETNNRVAAKAIEGFLSEIDNTLDDAKREKLFRLIQASNIMN